LVHFFVAISESEYKEKRFIWVHGPGGWTVQDKAAIAGEDLVVGSGRERDKTQSQLCPVTTPPTITNAGLQGRH
jgi:hypothetical protein